MRVNEIQKFREFKAKLRVFLLPFLLLLSVAGLAADNTEISIEVVPSTVYVNQQVTINVTVTNTDGVADPTGTVELELTDPNLGVVDSCTLDVGTQSDSQSVCTLYYTPSTGEPATHTFTVTYTPDDSTLFNGSSTTGSVDVLKREVVVEVEISSAAAYVNQGVTVTVTVRDATAEGTATAPTGSVTFSTSGIGQFDPSATVDLSPDPNGGAFSTATVTYTPTEAGAPTTIDVITASYGGSDVHAAGEGTDNLVVNRRTVKVDVVCNPGTVYVDQAATITVTVTDTTTEGTPVTPTGTVTFFSSAPGTFSAATATLAEVSPGVAQCQITYTPTDGNDTIHTIKATYGGSTVHLNGEGSFGLTVKKRQTEMDVDSQDSGGVYTLTATVRDVTDAGTKSAPVGTIYWEILSKDANGNPSGTLSADQCVPSPISASESRCSVTFTPDQNVAIHIVQAEYKPSTSPAVHGGSANFVQIEMQADPSFQADIHATTVGLLETCMALNLAAEAVGAIPDFDASDGVAFALAAAAELVCADNDADGLLDSVETFMGISPFEFDSDDDGMGDGDEIIAAGWRYGGGACPNPNESPDSDNDGILDGDEVDIYQTDVCNPDTDGDGVLDGLETATYALPDARNHANPLEADTDGDGLSDLIELDPGELATDINDPTYSPFVNSADSDGDGILDGDESTDGDAEWDYDQIGSTGTTGSGETHLCLADTDGDGLTDGEEEALFGRGEVEVHSSLGTITTPALDDDSDDDGLSDYEEQVVTHTDPLDYDSDDDGIWDVNELVATGGSWPARQFYQVSDPLDPDTDDDGLPDNIEYDGTGLGTGHGLGGSDDMVCPYVNNPDSDNDGLLDGYEDANQDG
ncbi:MAG: hypothetical protein DRN68_07000, partial [Thaumarchaeota archaeon]